ncbi:hypothetical protein [Actinopolymorpha singaporensis]|uniref:hypothetical protein n=1 Tax=Actinopolymorpha singaporensis TaxID=117157 RepID=UPI0012FD8F1E|nr:hypothetical protein [Actinopolymorpha singaporensis]
MITSRPEPHTAGQALCAERACHWRVSLGTPKVVSDPTRCPVRGRPMRAAVDRNRRILSITEFVALTG